MIPHRNTPEILSRCIETLGQFTSTTIHEVIVVDDASDPDVFEEVKRFVLATSKYGWKPTVLQLEKRGGFTAAVNQGLRHALREGAHIVGILNSDLEFVDNGDRDWLGLCLDSIALDHGNVQGKRNAIVSPMLVMGDGDTIQWGGESTTLTAPARHKGGSRKAGACGSRIFTRWHTFACVLLRGCALREIGLLDPNLRFICSDSDWCLRARWIGWRCVYEPAAVVKHVQSQTIQRERSVDQMRFDAQLFQDQQMFLSKWTGKAFQSLDMGPVDQWLEPL